ncbi:efflux RND transporter periplasmic adaptor subunit [Thalassospira mesophila]|uniref:efflux RND transporter periplasmic adaptor subunit n=1 Tax=Thalassospira mesophila TaxID=1293891 RepID=UPI0013020D5F|nr:efflux RND transporter periplasmic adaptor subunit [Thalassospira mesophila]
MLPINGFAQSASTNPTNDPVAAPQALRPYDVPGMNMPTLEDRADAKRINIYGNIDQKPVGETMSEARALVTTRSRALLSAEIPGRIADMPKRPGTRFAKGDVLVVFDCAAYRAQRAAVAADLAQAAAQYKAQQRLAELRTVGELDVVMAQAAVERAKAQLQLQDVYLSRCKITAPYAGAVVEWHSQPYQTANPGDQLIEIVGSGDLELELIVPSQWLGWLKVGQAITARIDETDSDVRAKVARLGAQIDPVSQTVKIYASLGEDIKTLLPGMSGRAVVDGHVSQ